MERCKGIEDGVGSSSAWGRGTFGSVFRHAGELARTVRRPAACGLTQGLFPLLHPSQWHTPFVSPAMHTQSPVM